MIKKIDMNSTEFQTQFELTKQFTDKVLDRFGFVYNPENDVNESVQQGLSRNKMIYGKRFCPCFMVIGQTKQEQKEADNRLCPCKPALEVEIPRDGKCHCGIFCTPEFAQNEAVKNEVSEVTHTHSRGLTKQECEVLLKKEQIDADELESLLEARTLKYIDFNLVDTREWMEWVGQRIKGCDYLVPTTSFYQSIEQLQNQKEKPVVVYCLSGSRSAYCQKVMYDLGFKCVSNLDYGIMTYKGATISGEDE